MTELEEQLKESPVSRHARLPLVAIVGRTNVGKSTIFNRLCGARKAIVESMPGVTRDRHYERVQGYEKNYLLVDTGGLGAEGEGLEREVEEQSRLAIEEADLILFVVDATVGLTAVEREIYQSRLRRQDVPVLVVANKADVRGTEAKSAEFYELGIEELLLVSAEHGKGFDLLTDRLEELLPEQEAIEPVDPGRAVTAVAVVGRPNVGKSTLINHLLGEERLVVSDIPGTTRDPIDSEVTIAGRHYRLIDTAGIRRKARISMRVEKVSVLNAFRAVERADVCLLLFDANQGMTEQDRRIAGLVEEAGRALILVANKWDMHDQGTQARKEFEDRVRFLLPSLHYAPLVEISAKEGSHVGRLLNIINKVADQYGRRYSTSELNRVLERVTAENQPPAPRGRQIKLQYITQVKSRPPTFMIHSNVQNVKKDFPQNYRRYVQNAFRRYLELEDVPVHLVLKSRERKKKETGRKGS